MNENQKPNNSNEPNKESEIIVNEYGATKDSTVVIEEETRTVLLTNDETIIFEKEPHIDISPKNRPRKINAGMWGPMEIATVGLGMLAILTVVLLVVFLVLPAKKELEANKAERNELEAQLISSRNKYGSITTTEARVAELVGSVNDFETRFLRNPLLDKTSLYQRINGLISAYGLTNTSGPDYAPLEISEGNQSGSESEAERGRAKFQSLFPGVYVTTTVEGSYQNLRRFIREVETSQQFVVISQIELEPAENEEEKPDPSKPVQASINQVQINPMMPNGFPQNPTFTQPVPQSQQPKIVRGKTRGETVSLRLEMAAYFRRPTFQPVAVSNQ
jgi:Tfp pilus assembly protein PilO